MKKLVEGVGINDANYEVCPRINGKVKWCPFYVTWVGMLKRVYSKKYHLKRPTYLGSTMCKEWLKFSSFKAWMEKQDWKGNALDKDIIVRGNKEYSPDYCMFVSLEINNILATNSSNRGSWPLGVCWHKSGKKFMSQCKINGKQTYLGMFSTPEEAHFHWQKFKILSIQSACNSTLNNILIECLSKAANKIQNDADKSIETTFF